MSGKLKQIHQKAAGIDVGAAKFFVALMAPMEKMRWSILTRSPVVG